MISNVKHVQMVESNFSLVGCVGGKNLEWLDTNMTKTQ
jgi:hypothetical protein